MDINTTLIIMNSIELESYKNDVVKNFGQPSVFQVARAENFKNAENTEDRDAYKGVSWIDYWRAMTGNHQTTLKCSCCGKEIVIGEPSTQQKIVYSFNGETDEEHRAQGGHIWLTAPAGADRQGGRFITPLCPACNAKRGQQINLNVDSVLCKEVGAQ